MANTREVLNDRFVAFSGIGLRQAARGTAIPNADLDVRDKCTITRDVVVDRRQYRDCRDEDLTGSKITRRLRRWTFDYAEVSPQIIARWTAYKLSASAAPSGVPANEAQSIAVVGDGTIAMTLEGRTVTTKTIPASGITAAKIQAALTAARMLFIEPGDVVVTGASTPFTATFPQTGKLGRANLPLMVGTGGFTVSASANGAQNYHALSRSTTRQLAYLSFALGWETDADRVEKFIDGVVESLTPTISLDGNVGFQVVVITPWEYDSIEEAFDIPDCVSIDALQAQDCRVQIDSVWQTEDINSLTAPVSNSIPLDRLSAFPFDGIDLQRTERGRQPVYGPIAASIFGSEVDSIYALAHSERTEDPVDVKIHFGFPGNRTSWLFPNSRVMFQANEQGEAGEARYSTINLDIQPEKDGVNPPFKAEAYLDQTEQFLDTP